MRHQVMESEVMTVQEVSTYLRCHTSTVYRLVKAGGMPAFRLGRDWRFLRSEIDSWIAGRHVQPYAPATSGRWDRPKRGGKPKR